MPSRIEDYALIGDCETADVVAFGVERLHGVQCDRRELAHQLAMLCGNAPIVLFMGRLQAEFR